MRRIRLGAMRLRGERNPVRHWRCDRPVLSGWSAAPIHDASRALIDAGVDPVEAIETVLPDGTVSMRASSIGEAARWTVADQRDGGLRPVPFKAYPDGPEMRLDALAEEWGRGRACARPRGSPEGYATG
jgi:hypothetical protein